MQTFTEHEEVKRSAAPILGLCATMFPYLYVVSSTRVFHFSFLFFSFKSKHNVGE